MNTQPSTATDRIEFLHPLHEFARCPYHVEGFALAAASIPDGNGDFTVRCIECNRVYPVTRGVYRLMPDELRTDTDMDDSAASADDSQMRREMRQRDARSARAVATKRQPRGAPLYWMNVQYDAVIRHADIQTEGVCIDFGAGVGRYVPWELERVGRLVATDFSHDSLAVLHESLTTEQRARCLLIQCDVARLAVASGVASSGMSVEVLQHLPSPRMRMAMIENMARTLRPGAKFCLVTKAHAPMVRMIAPLRWLKWKLSRAAGRDAAPPSLSQQQTDGDIATYWYRYGELRRIVEPQFEIEKHLGIVAYGCFPVANLPHDVALRFDAILERRSFGRAFGRDMLLCLRRRSH